MRRETEVQARYQTRFLVLFGELYLVHIGPSHSLNGFHQDHMRWMSSWIPPFGAGASVEKGKPKLAMDGCYHPRMLVFSAQLAHHHHFVKRDDLRTHNKHGTGRRHHRREVGRQAPLNGAFARKVLKIGLNCFMQLLASL
jgi:hypothetical protein